MYFSDFIDRINHYQQAPLGGINSHFKLAPEIRKKFSKKMIDNNHPKKAAVLALFYPDTLKNTKFILTQRASYYGTHSSQISFPGGKYDENDATLKETALRETFEEIGISSEEIKIFRQLSETYIPPSNFMVSPFIGYSNHKPIFTPNYEVAKIIEVAVNELLDESNFVHTSINTSYMNNVEVPSFRLNNFIVWGATAMILSETKDLIKQ